LPTFAIKTKDFFPSHINPGYYTDAIFEYFTVFDDLNHRLLSKDSTPISGPSRVHEHDNTVEHQNINFTHRADPLFPFIPRVIDRPLIIIAHGSQLERTFNLKKIYQASNQLIPSDGSISFVAQKYEGIVPDIQTIQLYLTRAIKPQITPKHHLYNNTFYPFETTLDDYWFARDIGPNPIKGTQGWVTTRSYAGMQDIIHQIKECYDLFSASSQIQSSDPFKLNVERFIDTATSQTPCDVIYVRTGEVSLSQILRTLYNQFALLYRDIRVLCCRNAEFYSPQPPDYLFYEKTRIIRECQEFSLPQQYTIQIQTLLTLIRDINTAQLSIPPDQLNFRKSAQEFKFFPDQIDISIPQIVPLIQDSLFYISRYFCMLHNKIVPSFEHYSFQNIEIILKSSRSISHYFFNLVKEFNKTDPRKPIQDVSQEEISKDLCLESFLNGIIFSLFSFRGNTKRMLHFLESENLAKSSENQLKYVKLLKNHQLGVFAW